MFLQIILAIVILNFLRKTLREQGQLVKWNKLLLGGILFSIGLVALEIVTEKNAFILWIGHALLLSLVYLIYTRGEFTHARPLMIALLPLIIIAFINDLTEVAAPQFYKTWENYFETVQNFAVLWSVAYWFITRRQRKALEEEKRKAEEKEKEFQISEKLKAQLEIQVAQRTAELTEQKKELEKAFENLKATQAQLIQSEKMASLGELTAGIAHEIQNPLNFVNNFSELNAELVDELLAEIAKGNSNEVTALAKDIKANEEKINHHGKRADAIVKGMLQHSRTSSGQKEWTDINELCDEYLRLSFHGLRAKDKSFNAKFETNLDPSIGKIKVVRQEIGRVILNIINNAFYSVTEKKKLHPEGYEPSVTVATKKVNQQVEIRITDNGTGIPQKVIDKIFQPFFTTKPAGQGTGLGLSLSYDIVTKGHGGELTVDTTEGNGTTFIIIFPL